MAIIVDKVQKRKDIALACKELFFLHGIKDLTISQIAKTAGVGKGTIYDYFQNKEDIIFEIVNILIQERDFIVQERISKESITKEKIKLFSSFFYSDEDKQLRQLYKEFISITLASADKNMIEFQTKCFNNYYAWLETIIQDAINNGEIIEESKKLSRGMFVTAKGFFIANASSNMVNDVKKELEDYIDAIFELIEVKQ